jgi:hypothetical protein
MTITEIRTLDEALTSLDEVGKLFESLSTKYPAVKADISFVSIVVDNIKDLLPSCDPGLIGTLVSFGESIETIYRKAQMRKVDISWDDRTEINKAITKVIDAVNKALKINCGCKFTGV